jgi:hypothetical protein
MQPGNSATPVIITLIVAIVGTAILWNMDFGPSTAVRNDGRPQKTPAWRHSGWGLQRHRLVTSCWGQPIQLKLQFAIIARLA